LYSIRTGCVYSLLVSAALAQDRYPLEAPDRSNPRATIKTFLESGDVAAAYFAGQYHANPSLQTYRQLQSLFQTPLQCLDLSGVPPASRGKTGGAAAVALYETLGRIELPPLDQIPGPEFLDRAGTTNQSRWAIPHTGIVLSRMANGPNAGDFLFSADTVSRAGEFYNRVRQLPYIRTVPVQGLYDWRITGGGWMLPYSWIESMPHWLRRSLAGQAVWKWAALALLLAAFAVALRIVHRLSRMRFGAGHAFLVALTQLLLPLFVLAAVPVVTYLVLVQINFINKVGIAIELVAAAVMYLAGAWLSWRAAPVVAEAFIASPNIAPESIDAHLIRICLRLLGFLGAAGLLALGADRLGVPVYGIIAGLGVGGLAIALAAQPTIENLIGGLSLFADKPIRVGNFCRYGDGLGTVEAIGLRSTRIRGGDRTVTTIPNAMLSKMPIVNFAPRDRMLLLVKLGVRCETSAEQLRFVLTRLREMLLAHPRIDSESARARLIGLGASSRDIEVFAYATTADWNEFLAIQEDVLLRIIDIVEQSGSGFAFPSQTLYLGRDTPLDCAKTQAAESHVRQWREEGRLPFPNFSSDQIERIRDTLVYPPPGSTEARPEPALENPKTEKLKTEK
jgi:MscS family membrane protein